MAVTVKALSSLSFDANNDPNQTAGPCQACTYALPALNICAPDYFEKGYVVCRSCGWQVDLWGATLGYYSASRAWGPTSLGAAVLNIRLDMTTYVYTEVDLTNHGMPADAKVLSVLYNAVWNENGSVFPQEWHGNVPPRKVHGTILRLLSIPLGEGPLPRTGQVDIRVIWVRADDSPAWPYLVTAFESTVIGDSAPALVFAQSAVEISMMPFIERRLQQHAGKKAVSDFMSGTLTYSHALNIVLPFLCGELRLANMPNEVRGALNALRRTRNAIIHRGVRSDSITTEQLTSGMTAAAFGFEFMRYVGPKLAY
jgi:hypothetical protein